MSIQTEELRFVATPEKGEVSAILMRPEHSTHILTLAHGAGGNMRTGHLRTIAERLAEQQIATLRYNFPYSEHGKARDSKDVCTATVRAAVATAARITSKLPILAGGHSFGGRMTTTAASEAPLDGVHGLVLFSFPLHLPGKPDTKRAEHLTSITIPILFLSGTRDTFASLDLLRPVIAGLGRRATLHPLDTAEHGFRILKKSRQSTEDVYVEAARTVREWASALK